MKQPSQDNITAFLQGYQQCRADALRLVAAARHKKASVSNAVITGTQRQLTDWMLRAENHGFMIPAPDTAQARTASWAMTAFALGIACGGLLVGWAQ
jgi:hypothetical protein